MDVSAFTTPESAAWMLRSQMSNALLTRLSSGNPIVDTFISLALLSSQDMVIQFLKKVLGDMSKFPQFLMFVFKLLNRRVRALRGVTEVTTMLKTAEVKFFTDDRKINALYDPVVWYLNEFTDVVKESAVLLESCKETYPEFAQRVPQASKAKIVWNDIEIHYEITKQTFTLYAQREHKKENIIITFTVDLPSTYQGDFFDDFIKYCCVEYEKAQKARVWKPRAYHNEGGVWKSKELKAKRNPSTVILPGNLMEDIIRDVLTFKGDEEWYVERSIRYTRGYLFCGPPGTGKSSTIHAIATKTNSSVYYVVLSEITSDAELFKLFQSIEKNSVVVFEDIDCATSIIKNRAEQNIEEELLEKQAELEEQLDRLSEGKRVIRETQPKKNTLTLASFLKVLDGDFGISDGHIVIMTTNHIEKIDPAIIRAGRIDRKIQYGYCNTAQIRDLYKSIFGDIEPKEYEFKEGVHSPAEIRNVFIQYKNDPIVAWKEIIKIDEGM